MNHRPRKRFGQHFLHDPGVIARIVAAVDPRPGQNLVEIGPGRGALTRALLKRNPKLQVVELDRDLAAALAETLGHPPGLTIHQADALAFDFSALAGDGRLRVTGNLPYNISTPLLFHLFDQADVIVDMHFMLQREVVDRLVAAPGGKTYGRLSVMAQARCKMTSLIHVGPGAFNPPPKVDSALIRLLPHALSSDQARLLESLSRVVRAAFGQRRKTLRNSLKGLLDEAAIRSAEIDPGARAETLDVEAYRRLAGVLEPQMNADEQVSMVNEETPVIPESPQAMSGTSIRRHHHSRSALITAMGMTTRTIFIGDIQGCADAFNRLLERIRFDPAADRLCLAGDLVNRGGQSVQVLQQVMELGRPHFTVLGNHDLHLLAYARAYPDVGESNREFEQVLEHPAGDRLLDWLRKQPLLRTDETTRIALVHAGIDPRWDRARAADCARELEAVLGGPEYGEFLDRMYGNSPDRSEAGLPRWERLRAITNVLTRMRFVDAEGHLNFSSKGDLQNPPAGYRPWFELLHPDWDDWTVVFGHWSLLGFHQTANAICLDSGCVWGGQLTALVVKQDQRQIVQVECGKR